MVSNISNEEIVLFDLQMRSYQVLPLQISVDQGIMAMKGYSTFPKASEVEPHNQM